MCRLYLVLRWFARRWLLFTGIFVAYAFLYGILGFWLKEPKNTWLTNAYLTILLFTLNNSDVAKNVEWDLEIARWLGFVVWFLTIAAILIRLFSQPALRVLVAVHTFFRGGHVIVAGLGAPDSERERLVERLRKLGREVVVVEPDANHPGLETCRQAGAICQIGSPYESVMLRRARLKRAGTLLALCEDDRKNVHLLAMAASLLGGASAGSSTEDEDPLAPSRPDNIGCVVQVSEPRLLEALGRHVLHRDPSDRLHMRLFSMHEMVARTMLRECLIGPDKPPRKMMLLGTGAHGRLGQALILRAIKDYWIDKKPEDSGVLEFHIYDDNAGQFVHCVHGVMEKDMANLCRLEPEVCLANRCGFRGDEARRKLLETNFDAIFICMGDESQALIQASHLRGVVPDVPIIVRVRDESTGYGALMQWPNAGGLGPNIHPVGSHDRIFDLAVSLNPMVEMVAQVLHQDYLSLTQEKIRVAKMKGEVEEVRRLEKKDSFKPWRKLPADKRDANRALAQRLHLHMTVPAVNGRSSHKHVPKFHPQGLISARGLFQLEPEEVEALAMQEHEMWMQERLARGWRYGEKEDADAKTNPNLVPWDKLDPGTQEYDRNIIRRLPYVFAKADYEVVPVA